MLLKLLLCACTSSTQGARWSSVIGAIRPTGRTTIAARRRVGVAHRLCAALSLSCCVCFVNAGSVDYRTTAQGAQWDLWRLCMDECVDVSYLIVSNSDNRPVRVRLTMVVPTLLTSPRLVFQACGTAVTTQACPRQPAVPIVSRLYACVRVFRARTRSTYSCCVDSIGSSSEQARAQMDATESVLITAARSPTVRIAGSD